MNPLTKALELLRRAYGARGVLSPDQPVSFAPKGAHGPAVTGPPRKRPKRPFQRDPVERPSPVATESPSELRERAKAEDLVREPASDFAATEFRRKIDDAGNLSPKTPAAAASEAARSPTLRAHLFLAKRSAPWPPEKLSLALQGGGSFGAFTWGVLDRLLEEPAIDFDAVSGSSAGAVNAVLLASGMIDGGREGARARLSRFWRRASQAAALVPQASPLGAGLELIARMMSPYQFNPFNVNPLREALTAEVDFARLRERSNIKLLLGATRVRDGGLRILTNDELTVDAVLASACLPLLHHAIELDGEPYWDGGYAANPPLIPLVRACDSSHILIVQVTPNMSDRLPKTNSEIAARIEQIQFNATLNSELEALKNGKIIGAAEKLRRLRIGRISADDHFEAFGAESAANLRWDFLDRLHRGGRAAAEHWLNQDLPALRRRA